ncbi:MAG: PEP/pyruvate-binding domain-containing protein [Pseudomonadota bacterium]
MKDFKTLLKEQGFQKRFQEFHNLMRYRVKEVLIVSSLYDSFILEEDGQFYDQIFSEYHDLNLSQAPIVTRVSNAKEALKMLKEEKRFDLVITTLNLKDMEAKEFANKVKTLGLDIPVVLLTYNTRELNEISKESQNHLFEKVFLWQGDFRIFIAIIKFIEDKKNVDHDTKTVGVQSIILIEDNVHYYSSFLPLIYDQLFLHSQSLISEGINVAQKLLRMRARPKILLCSNYEEAENYYNKYESCILGVISDVEFPRNGVLEEDAGLVFGKQVKSSHFDIPILLQSDSPKWKEHANNIGASFLLKSSNTLLHELQEFMKTRFGFGDFVFRKPDGKEISNAPDLKALEKELYVISDESLSYHAARNHFSTWLKSRTEFYLALKLRPRSEDDFVDLDSMRRHIISSLRDYRQQKSRSIVSDFDPKTFDISSSVAKIGGGSLGGKARGLAFVNTLISNFHIRHIYKGIQISIPPAIVLGTDVFDQYMQNNDLLDYAIEQKKDEKILKKFLKAKFPKQIKKQLQNYLELIDYPLAVRSSSLLEDSKHQPFAGIYETYMIPNNHYDINIRLKQLVRAIKQVYASAFSSRSKAYIKATHYRLEEEKMAVIIQKLVGSRFNDRYYPNFSGVARTHNFYPRPPALSSDGIVSISLGLGEMVVGGGPVMRFCPKYPNHDLHFANIEDMLEYSQKDFFALKLPDPKAEIDPNELETIKLGKYSLKEAETDGSLSYIGSSYSPEDDRLSEGVSRNGVRVITFAPILKGKMFPLSEIVQLIMDMGSWGLNSPVEIEFSVNLSTPANTNKKFAILQIRPLVKSHEAEELNVEEKDKSKILCKSANVLGNGKIQEIYDIITVDPEKFDRAKTKEVATEISQLNSRLASENIPYMIFGMGRWGSSDPWLGIPVTWEQINGAHVMIETGFKDIKVDPSQGSHFFQNLTSFQIGYFTISPKTTEDFVDWNFLTKEKSISEFQYIKHLRFKKPLIVKMNGQTNKGIILKP